MSEEFLFGFLGGVLGTIMFFILAAAISLSDSQFTKPPPVPKMPKWKPQKEYRP